METQTISNFEKYSESIAAMANLMLIIYKNAALDFANKELTDEEGNWVLNNFGYWLGRPCDEDAKYLGIVG